MTIFLERLFNSGFDETVKRKSYGASFKGSFQPLMDGGSSYEKNFLITILKKNSLHDAKLLKKKKTEEIHSQLSK